MLRTVSLKSLQCSLLTVSCNKRIVPILNDWEKTIPVWEQTQQLVCKATRQGVCMTFLDKCRIEDGKSMWKFDFRANELVYYGIDFKERLISEHFSPNLQHMSVQLESGRLMTFR